MKKLMLLAALLAMVVVAAVPAIAQVEQEFDEQDVESGEVEQSFTITGGEGDNGSQCVGINGTANTGNAQNQIGVLQYASEAEEFEFEEIESDVTFEDVSSTTTCDQQVNQAATASSS